MELLTISLADYLATTGESAENFKLVGVEFSNAVTIDWYPSNFDKEVKKSFIEQLPKNTQVVVGLQKLCFKSVSTGISSSMTYASYLGTAVVRK